MRITATQIENWADTRDAQGMLPILVRRLIGATSKTTALSIPGGDSVNSPGWDGQVQVAEGCAWVPPAESFWEMGCSADITAKARADFKKRHAEIAPEVAARTTFVFVSPRRWPRKDEWKREAAQQGAWREIRAYDADDLEAWIEAAPSVALWFGEHLGLRGSGIESIARYWENWRGQTQLSITADALLAGREEAKNALSDALSKIPPLIGIEADSSDEAVAFVCAVLGSHDRREAAACITTEDGWAFADANSALQIGLAATPEVAIHRAPRDGFTLIIPFSAGDRAAHFLGSAARAAGEPHIVLERPRANQFEEALKRLGEESADATRLTHATGRSWSVYRRVRAKNPALRRPGWLNDRASRCLVALTLIGAWSSTKTGDRACLEAVAAKPYDSLEVELRHIATLDDAPVLQIGSVWKAKAPIDLLYLFAPEITTAELSRFFSIADAILAKPDPALELEDSKRWMAGVYGKVREESGLVIESIVDSLAKLSVYAENSHDAHAALIRDGVDTLVRRLLFDADSDRWLSLHGVLKELAEASPDVFLRCIEASLARPDAPVRRLLSETEESGLFGRCWHAGLLWALEILAWSPTRLALVADILAQLTTTQIRGNWANTPLRTLSSFFRTWWPQTTATIDQRIAVIDRLIRTHNDVAWDLMYSLVPRQAGWATANAKPRWRDDDSGAGRPAISSELGTYLSEVAARIIEEARLHPRRIAQLVDTLDSFDGTYKKEIVSLVESSRELDDDGREILRSSVRKYLNWHNSYNESGTKKSRTAADRLGTQFEALAPIDVIKRHAWLFTNGWAELPDGRRESFEKQDEVRARMRGEALQEVIHERGLDGLTALATLSGNAWLVGWQLGRADIAEPEIIDWIAKQFATAGRQFHQPLISGIVHALPSERRRIILVKTLDSHLSEIGDSDGVAAFLSSAPCEHETLGILESFPEEIQQSYWKSVRPGYVRGQSAELAYAVDKLVAVGRHRTAFLALQPDCKNVAPEQLNLILDGIRAGAEPEGPLPDGWQVGEAIEVMQKSGKVARRALALLEFAFFPGLEHDTHGVKNLYAEMLCDPALFMECICLVYRRHNGPTEPVEEAKKTAAELAWRVLHEGRGIPGTKDDNTIDEAGFTAWVESVRHLAKDHDRADATDTVIGQWFSSCPADEDQTWPCLPVRNLLDQGDAEHIREGFLMGVMNNRGVTTRSSDEGGGQERALASKYRKLAEPLHNSHPRVAALLEHLSQHYEEHARREDWNAQLRIEGH